MKDIKRRFTRWYVGKGYRFGYSFSRYEKINSDDPFEIPCGAFKAYWKCPLWVKPLLILFSPSVYYMETAGAAFVKAFEEGLKEGLKMKFKVCDYCGAHLDIGEMCDCRNDGNGGANTPDNKSEERTNDNDRH